MTHPGDPVSVAGQLQEIDPLCPLLTFWFPAIVWVDTLVEAEEVVRQQPDDNAVRQELLLATDSAELLRIDAQQAKEPGFRGGATMLKAAQMAGDWPQFLLPVS